MNERLYCPMCERDVDSGELIYEILPPNGFISSNKKLEHYKSGTPAVFNMRDCLIKFSHMECGWQLETGKTPPDVPAAMDGKQQQEQERK